MILIIGTKDNIKKYCKFVTDTSEIDGNVDNVIFTSSYSVIKKIELMATQQKIIIPTIVLNENGIEYCLLENELPLNDISKEVIEIYKSKIRESFK